MNTKDNFKHESQRNMIVAIDNFFFRTLNKRNFLISNLSSNRDQIIRYDLYISMCIKNRAKITKGGYNYILEEMWDWRPIFPLNNQLLPKITSLQMMSERVEN
tara:strand:+ start:140 stop:448 length:309 start_codon:yes stop_codon:yes gene_type:complete